MNYSKGISWINDCIIPIFDEKILIKKYTSQKEVIVDTTILIFGLMNYWINYIY